MATNSRMPPQTRRKGARGPGAINAATEAKIKFFTAVKANNMERVMEMIGTIDLNMVDETAGNITPLMAAITKGYTRIAKILIDARANINGRDKNGETALMFTVSFNREEIAKMLIDSGADLNIKNNDGETALMISINKHVMNIAKILIEAGADLNTKNNFSETALMIAIIKNKDRAVKMLIDAGADLNIKNRRDETALMLAIASGDIDIIKMLIDAGTDVNIRNIYGSTALIKLLLPWTHMMKDDRVQIAKLLLDKGADVNKQDASGYTALYNAAYDGDTDIVKLLLERGPLLIPSIRNGIKRKTFSPEIVELLAAHYFPRKNKTSVPWKGQSRGNIEKFDTIFESEEAMRNWSFCPICLGWASRSDGCMYMNHNCSKMPYYHAELYDKYKNREGLISWCTICGRICAGHYHYPVIDADAARPHPLIFERSNPFETDCRISNGGGGLPEKIARIRQLRETARELQSEIGKMEHDDAMNTLVEDAWNAALHPENQKIRNIATTKTWNIPATNFPANVAISEAANVIANANDPTKYSVPTVLSPGVGAAAEGRNAGYEYNSVSFADDIPLIVFKHKDKDGNERVHPQIGKDSLLADLMISEKRGKCFDADCGGLLYPREIELAFADPKLAPTVTEEDKAKVAKYKEWFNKWRAEDAKTGGRRRRSTRRNRQAKRRRTRK